MTINAKNSLSFTLPVERPSSTQSDVKFRWFGRRRLPLVKARNTNNNENLVEEQHIAQKGPRDCIPLQADKLECCPIQTSSQCDTPVSIKQSHASSSLSPCEMTNNLNLPAIVTESRGTSECRKVYLSGSQNIAGKRRVSISSLSTSSETKKRRLDDGCADSPSSVTAARHSRAAVKFGFYESEDDNESLEDEENSIASDCDDFSGSIVSMDSKSSIGIAKRTYRIQFERYADVVEIPHRLSYTNKQRSRMWNGTKVIRENARRNKIEYEYECWDWKEAIEEDEFCILNGDKVHPAHVNDE